MDGSFPDETVEIGVRLRAVGSTFAFDYRATHESHQHHVAPNGDIDLSDIRMPQPVGVRFALENPEVTIEGGRYDLQFDHDSLWLGPKGELNPAGPYRPGLLERLLGRSQFHSVSVDNQTLSFIDRNDNHKTYKYTLRVRAVAHDGRSLYLEHEPIIKNR